MTDDDQARSVRASGTIRRTGPPWPRLVGAAAMVIMVGIGLGLRGSGDASPGETQAETTPTTAATVEPDPNVTPLPMSLLAAERFSAAPGPQTLGALVSSIGGLDAIELGVAVGAFDLVRFDPLDHDRLLASVRSNFGEARNHKTNEVWHVDEGGLVQTIWAPDAIHDFAHFNVDGTITMWVRPGDGLGFGPRRANVLGNDGRPLASSDPLFASRFTSAGGVLFALTGDGNYHPLEQTYVELVADDGATQARLDSGADYGWIDNPTPNLLVAYPRDAEGVTAVWDAATLRRLDGHPLAGRRYRRAAISGDGRTAVGVRFDGRLEQVDLNTGQRQSVFGSIDPWGVDQPITVSVDGRIVVTVERSGRVSLWWAGVDSPVATVAADAAQPRWVSEPFGARSTSAVAAGAQRLALRRSARSGTPVSWSVVDTSIEGMIDHACRLAGRRLTDGERSALGLGGSSPACRP